MTRSTAERSRGTDTGYCSSHRLAHGDARARAARAAAHAAAAAASRGRAHIFGILYRDPAVIDGLRSGEDPAPPMYVRARMCTLYSCTSGCYAYIWAPDRPFSDKRVIIFAPRELKNGWTFGPRVCARLSASISISGPRGCGGVAVPILQR